MGAVDIIVGCPHRLAQPIGPHTRYPCPMCAAFGVPPRWAVALTVDRTHLRPRLADAAVTVARPSTPPLTVEAVAKARGVTVDTLRAIQTLTSIWTESLRTPFTDEFKATLTGAPPGAEVVMTRLPETEEDRVRNVVRFEAQQSVSIPRQHIETMAQRLYGRRLRP